MFGSQDCDRSVAWMETLEDRNLMSASGVGAMLADSSPLDGINQPALLQSFAPHKAVSTVNVVGSWKGTYTVNGSRTVYGVTARVVSQKGTSAVVDFTGLTAMIGTNTWRTTIILGQKSSVSAILSGKNVQAGFAATVSSNGKQISGQWSAIMPKGGWKSGTLTIKRT